MKMEPNFSFPFPPYDIQKKFMRELYFTIQSGKLGIFESPTGTGKSLSICCSALQWLKDCNKKILEDLENNIALLRQENINESSDIDWLQEEYEKIKRNQELMNLLAKVDKINKRKTKFEEMRSRVMKIKNNKESKTLDSYFCNIHKHTTDDGERKDNGQEDCGGKEDEDLILEDYEGKSDDCESDGDEKAEDDEKDNNIKVYISSRTHSQLSQFIGEIKRTVFSEGTRVVTLASRQHYCINTDVAKLKNVNLINERCLDMQKSKTKNTSVGGDGKVLKRSKTKSCSGCPYYNQSNINRLKERMLVDIMDMEDLVNNGKELKACPYYASRMALDDAEVVLVSHAGIVSAGARSGMSLKLEDNVLILDEAHGLTGALEQANSAPLSAKQLHSVKTYLQFYIKKYTMRLSSKNLLSLNQMSFVVGRLLNIIQNKCSTNKEDTSIYTLEDFVIKAEIDHMNLRPLVQFCRNTRLAPKLHGFSMRYNHQALDEEINLNSVPKKSNFEMFLNKISKLKAVEEVSDIKPQEKIEDKTPTQTEVSAGSSLYALLDFLERLCDRSQDGRVLAYCTEGIKGHLKYLLLNPAEHFSDVVRQSRSVILAGGTMEPINEFQAILLGNTAQDNKDKITVLRCDHVVPSDNVLAICLSKGPTNLNLNFSYENRQSKNLLEEVSRVLRNVSHIVPGGVVCFLPSYAYEATLYQHMLEHNIIQHITKKKVIFREPKAPGEVDQVLHSFASCVRTRSSGCTGALMLSVVGGKLSEGLNFSDDLGRCVMVVGLPYPNIKSPELQEKMSYLDGTRGRGTGSEYCDTLCMKAVNQCIGRAVRHANDYACVLLVDERYSRPQTVAALPPFVQKSLKTNCNFGSTVGSIAKFFSKHKNNQ